MKCLLPVSHKALLAVRGNPALTHLAGELQELAGVSEIIVAAEPESLVLFERWRDDFPAFVPVRTIAHDSFERSRFTRDIKMFAATLKECGNDDDLLVADGNNLFSCGLEEFAAAAAAVKPDVLAGVCRGVPVCLYYFPRETLGLIEEYSRAFPCAGPVSGYLNWLTGRAGVRIFNIEGERFNMDDADSYTQAMCLF